MKRSVLARPDLKVFMLAAILIVGVHTAASKKPEPGSGLNFPALGMDQVIPESEFRTLLEKAAREPDSSTFYRLSSHFLNRGESKKARFFMKCAEDIQAFEDDPEVF